MEIILFPHPVLRQASKPIKRVDAKLKEIIQEMFSLMYAHKGVGLAANQVGLPIRLFIANETGNPDEGEPLVFINPVISKGNGVEIAEEGCLSLPGIHADVKRNKTIQVQAYDLQGREIKQVVDGFLARIIQHETDHLDGVLLFDRLSEGAVRALENEIVNLDIDFRSKQRVGGIPSDEALIVASREWEARYC